MLSIGSNLLIMHHGLTLHLSTWNSGHDWSFMVKDRRFSTGESEVTGVNGPEVDILDLPTSPMHIQ